MRLITALRAQHLGWHFKQGWHKHRSRKVQDTGVAAELEQRGIVVEDALEFTKPEKPKFPHVTILPAHPEPPKMDETHPDYKEKACYIYGDANVLLEGIKQAQILTNTLAFDKLPEQLEAAANSQSLPEHIDRKIQNCIMESLVFDAEQVKLPKVHDPERTHFVLPRVYGISITRSLNLLTDRFFLECAKNAAPAFNNQRRVLTDARFKTVLHRGDDILRFPSLLEKIVFSQHGITPVAGKLEGEMPDMFPLKCTANIPKTNIYQLASIYPLSRSCKYAHPHTFFSKFNRQKSQHIHRQPVNDDQFKSRTLMKGFITAAARARHLYGDNFGGPLPEPIVTQCIHTNGRQFHFSVYQLNTLELTGDSNVRNYWFHTPVKDLYSECGYVKGRPVLEGYNNEVFRYVNALYNNS